MFYRNEGVQGRRAIEAIQATWEHAYSRPMTNLRRSMPNRFCSTRKPIAGCRWPARRASRSSVRHVHGMRAAGSAAIELAPGATLRAYGRGTFLVLSGRGTLGGRPYRRLTTVYLNTGESATFTAAENLGDPLVRSPRSRPDAPRIRNPCRSSLGARFTAVPRQARDDRGRALPPCHPERSAAGSESKDRHDRRDCGCPSTSSG